MAMIETAPQDGISGFTVAVIGLGLMGGSIAKALKRGIGVAVTAYDSDAGLLQSALAEGVIDKAAADGRDAVAQADLTVLCLYPEASVRFFREHVGYFKPGSVVSDICGVKRPVVEGIEPLLDGSVDFVPGHPMAGRERSGYQYSDGSLFDRCNYLLTPRPGCSPSAVELVKRFAGALGAGRIIVTDPEEHDEMISYTSQLPHALAVAYVLAAGERDPLPFSAGSYRDVSRVAAINAPMWAELFLENDDALLAEIARLRGEMQEIERWIRAGDREGLTAHLAAAARAREAKE